ncbi:MAG: hypothetical protein ABSD77_02635 [Verrucomicrobiota bacterium]|jgi:hypothetical protein
MNIEHTDKAQNPADLPLVITARDGRDLKLLKTFLVGSDFFVGVYEGSISPFDIIIKYRQFIEDKWSRPRTPKHIHWAVDLLLKMQTKKETTIEFIEFIKGKWKDVQPLKSNLEREEFLSSISKHVGDLEKFKELETRGEYSVDFLYKLACLLMTQEKSNRHDAYMFANLLNELSKQNSNIYSIVSAATFSGRG